MDQKIKDICNFDDSKLDELSASDQWWKDAASWYKKVRELMFSQLSDVQKSWVTSMKTKYNQAG